MSKIHKVPESELFHDPWDCNSCSSGNICRDSYGGKYYQQLIALGYEQYFDYSVDMVGLRLPCNRVRIWQRIKTFIFGE